MAEQLAVNIFTDGLNTDSHPLTTLENQLTDALNATFITYNGNEKILQNDMGNTLILDSQTGNVMGLSNGFVPVGMKEYGGILYIASYNPETDEGELGTIPSPKILKVYNKEADPDKNIEAEAVKELTEVEKLTDPDKNMPSLYSAVLNMESGYVISDVIKVGDEFIPILDLEGIDLEFIRGDLKTSESKNFTYGEFARYPVITQLKEIVNSDGAVSIQTIPGWYNIKLYSKSSEGSLETELSNVVATPLQYYVEGQDSVVTSPYWFILKSDLENKTLDFERCLHSSEKDANVYRKYPNIPRGKLLVKLVPNIPTGFTCSMNLSTKINSPFTFIYKKQ